MMTARHLLTMTAIALGIAVFPGCDDGHAHTDADAHEHDAEHEHDEHAHDGDEHDHDAHENAEHADEVTLSPEAIERWSIRVEPAQRRPLVETFIVPARVTFNRERVAHVGSVVSGRVGEIVARIGDRVQRGDPLLVVDSPEFGRAQSEFLQRRAEAQTAEQMIEVAQQAYDRAKRLYDQNQSIALAEVQQRAGELQSVRGQARTARAAAVAAENTLHVLSMSQEQVEALARSTEIDQRYVITAPIDGQVIHLDATLGESIGPDGDPLLLLADMRTLWVLADVPEGRIGQVQPDGPAVVWPPSSDEPIRGVVAYVDPQINSTTRTIPVRIEVAGGGTMRPGSFVRVELGVSPPDAAAVDATLAVPAAAVQTVEGEPSVFVAVEGEPNTFARRVVRTGRTIGGMAPILDGLREGEPVVVSGSFILKAELGKAGAEHAH